MNDRAPYKSVITHGFVVDIDGKKISKSSTYNKPMDAMHFVNKHGADLVRLWVSSVNYTDDVPFSEEMFTRLADTYRRIRNTLRILHGNLFDFQPGSSGSGTLVDRWISARLDEVIDECRTAYAAFEFHKVYHTLNQFCAVDLSSLYVDITKDRMYCDAPDSERRRATQAVMSKVYDALCRLLAPVIAFTAEEAWQHFGGQGSVHLQLLPEPTSTGDSIANTEMAEALELRATVSRALEEARQHKIIGNSLEAKVVLELPAATARTWQSREEELGEILIVSELILIAGGETKAAIGKTDFEKCGRCWRHRKHVGKSAAHPDLCDRCEEVVAANQ